jgi:2-polyprenyl-3-methyl-5-hydroxy-6-metoxy-1,4-benzoquinol methylase
MEGDFDRYLSLHFGQVADPADSRRRLETVRANYVSLLPADRDASILEIGPGHGEFLELAVGELGYRRVAAIDLSAEVVASLAPRFADVAHFADVTRVLDTAAFLAGRAHSFDALFMMHVLEHVPKPQVVGLLTSARVALAPGGSLVIEVPNMANPIVGLAFRYGDFTHETGFTRTSLEQVLRMAGFEDIVVKALAIPGGSPARLLQKLGRFLVEGAVTLIGFLYSGRREIVAPNLVAVARAVRGAP